MNSIPPGHQAWKGAAADWLTPGRFVGLLGALFAICFPQVIAGLETFAYFDSGQFAYPVALYHREAFWRGEVPLWNPLSSCGIPFLAQWNTMTLYPPSLIYLLLPVPWSFDVFRLGHLVLAGLGMYLLAFHWTANRLAAAVAGVVFTFNGLTWCGLMWPHVIVALAWMPWVVLAAERAWRCGRRSIIMAVLATTMQMLSGGAEVILLTWLVLGALWLALLLRGDCPRWKITGRMLCLIGLTTALSAAQLVPFLELLGHSQRSTAYGGAGMANVAAMPLTGWANYLVPLFRCTRNAQGVFVQYGQGWTSSYFLGTATVALALVAIWKSPDRRVWLLAALGVFGLFMALGPRGWHYEVVQWLFPPLGFMRFPVKFVLLVNFVLPLLAAFGLSRFLTMSSARQSVEWKRIRWLLPMMLGSMGVIVGLAWARPVVPNEFPVTAGNALVRILFLLAIATCLVLLHGQTDLKLQRLLQAGLIALFWFDVFTHAGDLNPTVARREMEPAVIRGVFNWTNQLEAGVSRAMQGRHSFWQMLSQGSPQPESDILTRRLALSLNYNLLDRVPKIDGYYPLDLREFLDIFKRLYFGTNEAAALKDFLGVSHESDPTNAVNWIRRDSCLPLITAGQKPVFAAPDDMVAAILAEDFQPRHTVFLPLELRDKVHAKETPGARILSSQFSAHRVRIDVETESPALVVIAQTYFRPWRALVDESPVPLWRANHGFQALEVPAGRHRVSLTYEDTGFRCGVGVSCATLMGCAGAFHRWRRKPREEGIALS